MGSSQSNEYSNETNFRQPKTYGLSTYSPMPESLMGMHVNAVVFFPAMTTCLLFAMYGNRVRFAHLWLHVMAMGGCYASQHLKAIGEGSLGARFGMAGATLYFAGPYLQLMHIFPLIPKRRSFVVTNKNKKKKRQL